MRTIDNAQTGGLFPTPAERAESHARTTNEAVARSAPDPSPIASGRERMMRRIRAELLHFIRTAGVGGEFFAVDFTNHLDASGRFGDLRDHLDPRSFGGLFVTLTRSGVLVSMGYFPNGGGAATAYNSTHRPKYRVASLDFGALPWDELGAARSSRKGAA